MARMKEWTRPDSYTGAEWHGYRVFLGKHRDSDSVTRSNFSVGLRALRALPEYTGPAEDGSRIVVRESHWAVGWVEWIAVHESDVAGIAACEEMLARLDDYPVLSEDDLSDMEYREACDAWASASRRGRLDILRDSRATGVSMFAVRRDDLPSDDDGRLMEYLRGD